MGYGMTFRGTKTDVHKNQSSARQVHNWGPCLQCVDSNGGNIFPHNNERASNIQQFVQYKIVNEPGAASLHLENGTYIGYTTFERNGQPRTVFDACETSLGRGPSAPSEGVSPMASVGKAHICPLAQAPVTKLQIRPYLVFLEK